MEEQIILAPNPPDDSAEPPMQLDWAWKLAPGRQSLEHNWLRKGVVTWFRPGLVTPGSPAECSDRGHDDHHK